MERQYRAKAPWPSREPETLPLTCPILEHHVERVGNVAGRNRRVKLPFDDIAGEVVEHGRQIHPRSADDVEGGNIGLPHLVGADGLIVEPIASLDRGVGRTGD